MVGTPEQQPPQPALPERLDWALEWVWRHPQDTTPNTTKATKILAEAVLYYRTENARLIEAASMHIPPSRKHPHK